MLLTLIGSASVVFCFDVQSYTVIVELPILPIDSLTWWFLAANQAVKGSKPRQNRDLFSMSKVALNGSISTLY